MTPDYVTVQARIIKRLNLNQINNEIILRIIDL